MLGSLIRPWQVYQATRALLSGGVVAYPTEAVFGLGCLPHCETAITRILEIKSRPNDKGLIVVAASLDQLDRYITIDDQVDFKAIRESWPGPVTWLLPASSEVSEWITGGSDLVAVRVSAHPIVQSLCRQAGPIISTSANPSDKPPAKTTEQIRAYFGDSLDYILPGELGALSKPTEIRHGITGKIIRSGS